MTGAVSLKFLNHQDVNRIEQNLKSQINRKNANKAQDFIFLFASNIDQLCAKIFEHIQEEAKKGNIKANYSADIDKYSAVLISECLKRKTPVDIELEENIEYYKVINNELLPDILMPAAAHILLKMAWTPRHPSYQYQDRIKRYQVDPAAHNKMLYTFTKNATKTDIIFTSSDGQEIRAHKLILSLNSPYFDRMLNGKYKEGCKDKIEYNYHSTTINSLIQFIYEGSFDKSLLSPEMLVELLPLSGQVENEKLKNHCADLMSEYLLDSKVSDEVIISALDFAYTYDIKDFIVPCLKQAEDLEVSAAESKDLLATVDWSKIKKQNYANLLAIAVKNSFENVVKKLTAAIEEQMTNN